MTVNPMMLARIRQEAAEIRKLVDDDSETLLDTLDGETDALDLLDALIREYTEDDASAEMCKALAQRYQTRAKRLGDRKTARRGVIGQLLDAIGERKIARPLATVSRTRPHGEGRATALRHMSAPAGPGASHLPRQALAAPRIGHRDYPALPRAPRRTARRESLMGCPVWRRSHLPAPRG